MRLLSLALLMVVPAGVSAQVVRGVVRDSASGEPAAGVLVTLVQQGAGARRTVLTDAAGRFTIAAPAGGSYSLETKRIGVRPTVTPEFTVAAGEARDVALVIAPAVAVLDAVRVTGRSYCGHRVNEGAETASLWEEVRAALVATRLTREARAFPVTISAFKRTLDPVRFEVRTEERTEVRGMTFNPFASAPLASLSAHGYIVDDGQGSLIYRGPDVDVLLSDVFVRDHCFRAVVGNRERSGLVGLSFEPTSARKVPDIAGVLWIDGVTRELRRLEYSYTQSPVEVDRRLPISYIDFARLPSGAWIVQRWAIRMPHVAPPAPEGASNPLTAAEPRRNRLVAIYEEGGEATVGSGQGGAMLAVEGTVFDSSGGGPLPGARVLVRGTAHVTTVGPDGRFRLQVPDTGTYMVTFEHARLDTLGFDAPARPVHVAGAVTAADLAVPPLGAVRRALCPGSRSGTGILHGVVRSAAGAPAAWAALKYRWEELAGAAPSQQSAPAAGTDVRVIQSAAGATGVTDSRGRYVVCDVPPGRYRLTIATDAGESAQLDVSINADEIMAREARLGRR